MSQQQLATLFADISGSTRLYDELGDAVARPLIAACMELMDQAIRAGQGTVIKTIGDEIMCTFPGAAEAVAAAIAIQERVAEGIELPGGDSPHFLKIRIGLHHGPVIHEDGDVFGDSVNVAARMAALAKGDQILTTAQTVAALDGKAAATTRLLDKLPVKGKREVLEIHEVVWQEEDVTHIATGLFKTIAGNARLRLRCEDGEITLDQTSQPFTLGRGRSADMQVDESFASREHVRIEVLRGKFVLTDTSTNGTYVELDDSMVYLRREQIALRGTGKFSLGRAFDDGPIKPVSFEVLDSLTD